MAIRGKISPIQRNNLKPQGDTLAAISELFSLVAEMRTIRDDMLAAHAEANKLGENTAKIQKGDRGDRGPAGVGIRGEKGPKGEDGKHANPHEVAEIILPKVIEALPIIEGKEGRPGKDAVAPTPEEILDLLKEKLTIAHIPGLKREIDLVHNQLAGKIYGSNTTIRGGGDTVAAGVGISISRDSNGKVVITNTGSSSTIYTETPTGAVNGSNKVYTTAHTITTVMGFWINGEFIHPSEYSAVGTTITFVTALPAELSGTGFTIIYA